METNNKMTGIIAKAAAEKAVTETRKQPQTLKDYVRVMEGQFARALPKVMTPERFTRIAANPLLAALGRKDEKTKLPPGKRVRATLRQMSSNDSM